MRAVIAVAACALVLPGCGASAEGGAKRSGRLVDFSQKPPYVNALDIDPATGDFLMTTNRGFFRIDARTHAVARVRATVTASSQSAGVGTFLDILSTGPGKLLGSGHPDVKGQLPPYLGLIAAADGGRRAQRLEARRVRLPQDRGPPRPPAERRHDRRHAGRRAALERDVPRVNRVLMGLMFFPRGGSAHVARNLAHVAAAARAGRRASCRARCRCRGGPGDARAFYRGLDVHPVDFTRRARRARPAARRPAVPSLLRGPRGRAGPRVRLARRRRRRAPSRRLGPGAGGRGRGATPTCCTSTTSRRSTRRPRASRRTCRSSGTCTAPSC